jgi:CBS domain containing-hemolysin-like protein
MFIFGKKFLMALLLAYLFLALIVSFLCSIMEAVLLSAPQSFVLIRVEKGERWASTFYKMKKDIDKPLSAILTWNTIAHTVGAAGVGAQAIVVFGSEFFGVVSAVLTILILVLTEIIPKTLGAVYWSSLAPFSTKLLSGMIFLSYPVIIVSGFLTRILKKRTTDNTTSREEIAILANIGTNEGVFANKENIIIQNIIKLKEIKASEIMTPRVVMAVADEEMRLTEFRENKNFLKFSRIPVFYGETENITGYIIRQTVFEKLSEDKGQSTLKCIRRKIEIVHESSPLFSVWEVLLEKKEHIALVVDEYGGVAGIVTMEDIIESLLGFEIIDEKDTVNDMQQFARERWKMRQAKYNLLDEIRDESSSAD